MAHQMAGVAACPVGAMTSLPLWVHRRNDRTMDRTANLLISSNVHYAHFGADNKKQRKSITNKQERENLNISHTVNFL